jgi:hypothetical protein
MNAKKPQHIKEICIHLSDSEPIKYQTEIKIPKDEVQ